MKWRSRLGRQSIIPAAGGIVIIAVCCTAFYAAGAWAIARRLPRVNIDLTTPLGLTLLCVRRDGVPMQIVERSEPGFRAALEDESVRDIDKSIVRPQTRTRSRGAGRTAWSDMVMETSLVLRKSVDWPDAAGLAITPAQERDGPGDAVHPGERRLDPARARERSGVRQPDAGVAGGPGAEGVRDTADRGGGA